MYDKFDKIKLSKRKRNWKSTRRFRKTHSDSDVDYSRQRYYEDNDNTKTVESYEVGFKAISQKFQPVTTYVNPKDGVIESASPYPLFTSMNKVTVRNYGGDKNYAGNQLRTASTRMITRLKGLYDILSFKSLVNYNYMKPDQVVDTEFKPVPLNPESMTNHQVLVGEEVLANLFNETFRELDFFKLYVRRLKGKGPSESNPVDFARHRIAILNNYQTTIQSLLLVINMYNQTIGLEAMMKKMTFGNESVPLDQLFALFRRNVLKGKMDTIRNFLLQEYIDTDWYQKVVPFLGNPSRLANDMVDPLIITLPRYDIEDFDIYAKDKNGDTLVGQTNPISLTGFCNIWEDEDELVERKPGKLTDAIQAFIEMMSPSNIMRFCRLLYNRELLETWSAFPENIKQFIDKSDTVNGSPITLYYNYIDNILQSIIECLNLWSPVTADIRAMLKIASKSDLCKWSPNTTLTINGLDDKPVALEIFYNKTLIDILKANFFGPTSSHLNPNTGRIEEWTLADRSLGIPSFDATAGGVVITKPARRPNTNDNVTEDFAGLISAGQEDRKFRLCNRFGAIYDVIRVVEDLTKSDDYRKLDVIKVNLTDSELPFKQFALPKLEVSTPDLLNDTARSLSFTFKAIKTIFGGLMVVRGSTKTFDISDEYIYMVDIQIDNYSHELRAYARQNGPFLVKGLKTDFGL